MIPILYKEVTEGLVPNTYGIGALTDCLDCSITEERNGAYELTLTYASQGIHADSIEPNAIIKAKPNFTDEPQLFRIYKVGKNINGKFEVNAQHISYDLSGKVITNGSASGAQAACSLLDGYAGGFNIVTDKTATGFFEITEPSSIRSWFGGKQGSLLDVFGTAEWKYDNYTCSLLLHRGADRGVQIRYGKNLTELSQEISVDNLITGIVPYCIYQEAGDVQTGERVGTGLELGFTRDLAVNFTGVINFDDPDVTVGDQLDRLAHKYIDNNNLTNAVSSITLNFVQLKGVQDRIDLCDTVSIFFEPLGISASMKCVKTVWDVINEEYTSCTFGEARNTIADTIATQAKSIEDIPNSADVAAIASNISSKFTGNSGGNVILHDMNGDDKPEEFLIMDTDSIHTAQRLWRFDLGALWHTNGGYNSDDYWKVLDENGYINANAIKVGIISDVNGRSEINLVDGTARLYQLKALGSFDVVDIEGNSHCSLGHNSERAAWCNVGSSAQIYGYNSSFMGVGGTIDLTTNFNGAFRAQGNEEGAYCSLENADGDNTITLDGSDGKITCVSLTQTSSRSVKEHIRPIPDASRILDLQAVAFDFIDTTKGIDKRGFIAEDVAEILPNLVTPETDGKPASLDYVGMIPYLQSVIKSQEERIKALEDKLNLGG